MDTKKLTTLAMLSAIAYVMAVFARVPVVLFLRYDPKDVIIVIGGFIYGPMAAFMIAAVVSTVQMFTVSGTGVWGLLMNVITSSAFCCTAAVIYKGNRTMKGAATGLIAAFFVATIVAMLWNYFIAPVYMGLPREDVAMLLIPAFLPFNLIKNGLNAAIAILLYKHIKSALQLAGLLAPPSEQGSKFKFSFGIAVAAGFVLITCVMWVLTLQGRI